MEEKLHGDGGKAPDTPEPDDLLHDARAFTRRVLGFIAEEAGHNNERDFIGYLRELDKGPDGPCTNVWRAGALAYRCRTCQKSPNSALCVACFKQGNHEGCDYIIYESSSGGCCDCGDTNAIASEGCCPKHRPATHSDSVADDYGGLSPAVQDRIVLLLAIMLRWLQDWLDAEVAEVMTIDRGIRPHPDDMFGLLHNLCHHSFLRRLTIRALAVPRERLRLVECPGSRPEASQEPSPAGSADAGDVRQPCTEEAQGGSGEGAGSCWDPSWGSPPDPSWLERPSVLFAAYARLRAAAEAASGDLASDSACAVASDAGQEPLRQDAVGGSSPHAESGDMQITDDSLGRSSAAASQDEGMTCEPEEEGGVPATADEEFSSTADETSPSMLAEDTAPADLRDTNFGSNPASSLEDQELLKRFWHGCNVAPLPSVQEDVLATFTRLLHRLPEESLQQLTTILLLLLYEPEFKSMLVRALLPHYIDHLLQGYRYPELLEALDRLHVQLFTDPERTLEMVREDDLLDTLVEGLSRLLLEASVEYSQPSGPRNLHLSHPLIVGKAYSRVLSDLRAVLGHPQVVWFLVTDGLLTFWTVFDALRLLDGMCPFKCKAVGAHVEIDTTEWQHSIPLEVVTFTSTISIIFSTLSPWDADTLDIIRKKQECLQAVAKELLEHVYGMNEHPDEALETVRAKFGEDFAHVMVNLLDGQPVSAHWPSTQAVGAALAALYACWDRLQGCAYGLQQPGIVATPVVRFWTLSHLALLAIKKFVWFTQIKAGLWVRNGLACQSIAVLYRDAFWRESGFDKDCVLLQTWFAALEPSWTVPSFLKAFHLHADYIAPWDRRLTDGEGAPRESPIGHVLFPAVALRYLVTILRERGLYEQDLDVKLRRELVHCLARSEQGYSDIQHCLAAELNENPTFDKVLSEVADYLPPGLHAQGGRFRLRPSCWQEFDPFFLHYSPKQLHDALQNAQLQKWDPARQLRAPLPPSKGIQGLSRVLAETKLHRFAWHSLCEALRLDGSTGEDLALPAMNIFALVINLANSGAASPEGDQLRSDLRILLEGGVQRLPNSTGDPYEIRPSVLSVLQGLASSGEAGWEMQGCANGLLEIAHRFLADLDAQTSPEKPPLLDSVRERMMSDPGETSEGIARRPGGSPVKRQAASMNESEDRKRLAKAKQAEAMAAVRVQQAEFLKQAEAADTDMDTDDPAASSQPSPSGKASAMDPGTESAPAATHDCALCEGTDADCGPLAYVSQVHLCGLPRQAHRAMALQMKPDSGGEAPESSLLPSIFQQRWGLHVLCCGHKLHLPCLQKYRWRLRQQEQQDDIYEGAGLIRAEDGEFLCPTCRRISNTILPALAPEPEELPVTFQEATPSPASAADAQEAPGWHRAKASCGRGLGLGDAGVSKMDKDGSSALGREAERSGSGTAEHEACDQAGPAAAATLGTKAELEAGTSGGASAALYVQQLISDAQVALLGRHPEMPGGESCKTFAAEKMPVLVSKPQSDILSEREASERRGAVFVPAGALSQEALGVHLPVAEAFIKACSAVLATANHPESVCCLRYPNELEDNETLNGLVMEQFRYNSNSVRYDDPPFVPGPSLVWAALGHNLAHWEMTHSGKEQSSADGLLVSLDAANWRAIRNLSALAERITAPQLPVELLAQHCSPSPQEVLLWLGCLDIGTSSSSEVGSARPPINIAAGLMLPSCDSPEAAAEPLTESSDEHESSVSEMPGVLPDDTQLGGDAVVTGEDVNLGEGIVMGGRQAAGTAGPGDLEAAVRQASASISARLSGQEPEECKPSESSEGERAGLFMDTPFYQALLEKYAADGIGLHDAAAALVIALLRLQSHPEDVPWLAMHILVLTRRMHTDRSYEMEQLRALLMQGPEAIADDVDSIFAAHSAAHSQQQKSGIEDADWTGLRQIRLGPWAQRALQYSQRYLDPEAGRNPESRPWEFLSDSRAESSAQAMPANSPRPDESLHAEPIDPTDNVQAMQFCMARGSAEAAEAEGSQCAAAVVPQEDMASPPTPQPHAGPAQAANAGLGRDQITSMPDAWRSDSPHSDRDSEGSSSAESSAVASSSSGSEEPNLAEDPTRAKEPVETLNPKEAADEEPARATPMPGTWAAIVSDPYQMLLQLSLLMPLSEPGESPQAKRTRDQALLRLVYHVALTQALILAMEVKLQKSNLASQFSTSAILSAAQGIVEGRTNTHLLLFNALVTGFLAPFLRQAEAWLACRSTSQRSPNPAPAPGVCSQPFLAAYPPYHLVRPEDGGPADTAAVSHASHGPPSPARAGPDDAHREAAKGLSSVAELANAGADSAACGDAAARGTGSAGGVLPAPMQEVADEVFKMEALVRRLGLPDIPAALEALLQHPRLEMLLHRWGAGDCQNRVANTSRSRPVPGMDIPDLYAASLRKVHPVQPRLMQLPDQYQELYLLLTQRPCWTCWRVPDEPALCLMCGAMVCARDVTCLKPLIGCSRPHHGPYPGPCCRHAADCGAGTGVFLLVKATCILVLQGSRAYTVASPWLDAHGESDPYVRRGRPLRRNAPRWQRLEALWANGGLAGFDTLTMQGAWGGTALRGAQFY